MFLPIQWGMNMVLKYMMWMLKMEDLLKRIKLKFQIHLILQFPIMENTYIPLQTFGIESYIIEADGNLTLINYMLPLMV